MDKESKANYDSFAHLCRSLFVQESDLMSMLTVYCDDSGTDPGNPVAVVAGYIGEVKQWERFVIDWRKVLSEFEVSSVHMTDLENLRGQFSRERGWCEERRIDFLKKLYPIIKRYTLVPIGIALIKKDFEDIMPGELQQNFGFYGWCAHECIAAAKSWCEDSGQCQNSMKWVFEAGTQGQGQVSQIFSDLYGDADKRAKFRIGAWSFASKEVVPLQAADILAYEIFKHVKNHYVDESTIRPVRLSAISLFEDQGGNYCQYRNLKWLREWLNKYNRAKGCPHD